MIKKLNVPNTLSVLRVILTFFFVAAAVFLRNCHVLTRAIPAFLFGMAALTDFFDGKIAREQNIVTDFGKFIDPLADKFMIFGACITFLVIDPHTAPTFLWISAIIMLRELAVTSMRLVVANTSGIVIAASFFGKCKTVVQIVAVLVMFSEPVLGWFSALIGIDFLTAIFSRAILSYIAMVIMGIVTLASGIDYMRAYFPYINTNK